jgi:transposase-like protein
MDEREQQRKVRHRLAVIRHAEEVSGNVSATCRYYGIRRQVFYKWHRRYDELREAGLRDGSSRPLHSPTATDPEIVRKVVYLRRSYHFGPGRISMYLKRYHDVAISPSGVRGILKRLDAAVEEVPVEGALELGAVVGLDALGLERQAGEDLVDELDGGLLVVARVGPQHPQPGAVIDRGVLVVLAAAGTNGLDELDVNLDAVAGSCFS